MGAVAAGTGAYLLLANAGPASSQAVRVRSATTTTSTTTTTLAPTTTTTVDPGTLPQTMDRPTTTDAQFQAGLQGFWQSIVSGDPSPAMPFFFPLSAYVQVKRSRTRPRTGSSASSARTRVTSSRSTPSSVPGPAPPS